MSCHVRSSIYSIHCFLRSSINVSGLVYGIASDPDSGGILVQLVDGTILKLDAGKKNHTVLYRPRGYKAFFHAQLQVRRITLCCTGPEVIKLFSCSTAGKKNHTVLYRPRGYKTFFMLNCRSEESHCCTGPEVI